MKQKHLTAVVVGGFGLLVIGIIASTYSDLLSIRTLSKANARVFAREGEPITFLVSRSDQVRKLEICEETRNFILGRSDFVRCKSLQNFVAANQTRIATRIPKGLGRRVVITRYRGPDGSLLTDGPVEEAITLFILPARATAPAANQGGGSSGGGSGSSGGGGSAPIREIPLESVAPPKAAVTPNASTTPASTRTTSPAPKITPTATPFTATTPTPSGSPGF